mmetsp:Transcript_75086/g.170030  ORF Transcript_75086/g.170030 Transcript_75086/m.170030 type:complete len:262 (+) Transcript_75086:351-1136(+)
MPLLAREEDVHRADCVCRALWSSAAAARLLVKTPGLRRWEDEEHPPALDLCEPRVRPVVLGVQAADRAGCADGDLEVAGDELCPVHVERGAEQLHPPHREVVDSRGPQVPPAAVEDRPRGSQEGAPVVEAHPRERHGVVLLAVRIHLLDHADVVYVLRDGALHRCKVGALSVGLKHWRPCPELPSLVAVLAPPELHVPLAPLPVLGTVHEHRRLQQPRHPVHAGHLVALRDSGQPLHLAVLTQMPAEGPVLCSSLIYAVLG